MLHLQEVQLHMRQFSQIKKLFEESQLIQNEEEWKRIVEHIQKYDDRAILLLIHSG